ncbi:MAG: hypothetical protein V2B14_02850 [bacterium]
MQNKLLKKFYAFTLAEMLIVLTFLGVITTVTTVTVYNNIQNAQHITAWKSTYSDFTQAVSRVAIDHGGDLAGVFTDHNTFRDKILAYMNSIKKCDAGTATGANGCWHDANSWHHLSGATGGNFSPSARAILGNGTLIRFHILSVGCTNTVSPNNDNCGYLEFDINGYRGTNKVGKDIFGVEVLKKGNIIPFGTKDDSFYNHPTSYSCDVTAYPNTQGWSCSADYLKR